MLFVLKFWNDCVYLSNCCLANECKLFVQRHIKFKWMDATSLHMQTSKANKAEGKKKIKICLFPTALPISKGDVFAEQSPHLCSLHWGGEAPRGWPLCMQIVQLKDFLLREGLSRSSTGEGTSRLIEVQNRIWNDQDFQGTLQMRSSWALSLKATATLERQNREHGSRAHFQTIRRAWKIFWSTPKSSPIRGPPSSDLPPN